MYERILVAVDGSPTSDRGLSEAIRLAKLTGARLRLVNVVDDMGVISGMGEYGAACMGGLLEGMKEAGTQVLEDARATATRQGVGAETVLFDGLSGRVSDLIVAEAKRWGADLIVLGTHGRRGVRRMVLGSDAEQIVRAAPVPVLLVRSMELEATPEKQPAP